MTFSKSLRVALFPAGFLACVGMARAQSGPLSLEDAVNLARQRNGTVAAAYYNYLGSKEGTKQAFSAFLPTLNGSYTYNSDRFSTVNNGQTFWNQTEGGIYAATASWRLLDLGERNFSYLSAKRQEENQLFTAHQTLRQVLFNVQSGYFETLRAADLERVSLIQVDRAQAIFDQTSDQVRVGKTARKDKLQAQADLGNAKVTLLQSRNLTATNGALLKSLIGLPSGERLPQLPEYPMPDTSLVPVDLNRLLDEGVKARPDLIALRKGVESAQFNERLLNRQAGVTFALDGSFGESYAPDRQENRAFTLSLSYPIFDGGRSRAVARQAGYAVKADQKVLEQAERGARSDIESAFVQLTLDVERLKAAEDAYVAAKENFDAASASQKLGASTVIDVLTANVSLITAESNRIQAVYDYYIADISLKLATGQPLLGEPIGDALPQYK